MSPVFNCYQIPQFNCKFKKLAVSPQPMTGENHAFNCRNNFFHTNKCKSISLNFGMELPIYDGRGHVFSR